MLHHTVGAGEGRDLFDLHARAVLHVHRSQRRLDLKVCIANQKIQFGDTEEDFPPDIFIEQYLEEALFLLELIGIRVFKNDSGKPRRTSTRPVSIGSSKLSVEAKTSRKPFIKPSLPDHSLKAGQFVKTAMVNLASSGYTFTDEMLKTLCSEASMNKVLGMTRNLPFLKLYEPDDAKGHIIDGTPRFYSKPITFGSVSVYLNSQIYDADKEAFIRWYEAL